MSDLKQTCPACDLHASSVGMAFAQGDPCPNCRLPAEAAWAVLAARERGADAELIQRAADAERRAGVAERRVRVLEERLDRIERIADGQEDSDDH